MNSSWNQFAKRLVNQAVALQSAQAREPPGDNPQPEMAAAGKRAGVTGVLRGIVLQIELKRAER